MQKVHEGYTLQEVTKYIITRNYGVHASPSFLASHVSALHPMASAWRGSMHWMHWIKCLRSVASGLSSNFTTTREGLGAWDAFAGEG